MYDTYTVHKISSIANYEYCYFRFLELVQEYGEKNVMELPPYNARTHDGFMKHLTIRSGRWGVCQMLKLIPGWLASFLFSFFSGWLLTHNLFLWIWYMQVAVLLSWTYWGDRDCDTWELQLMINFVTKGDKHELLRPLVDQITSLFPQVVSRIVYSVSQLIPQYEIKLHEYICKEKKTMIHTYTNTHTQLWFVFLVSSTEFPNHRQWIFHRWVWLIMWTQQWARHQLWIRSMYHMAKNS